MGQELHIYAVNEAIEGRHTYLSRSQGESMVLPDLAGWLGLRQGGLDTDEIELFPTGDLAGMALSDYVTTAFDLEAAPNAQTAARMNALEGHVLLIPSAALAGAVAERPELTLVASLLMAQPDHSVGALEPLPEPKLETAPHAKTEAMPAGRRRLLAVFVAFILALIIVVGREIF